MPYKDKGKRALYHAKYSMDNAKELKEYHRLWRMGHPDAVSDYARCGRAEIKIEVLARYGRLGKLECCWPECNITDVDMLVLDHIENDGAEKRRSGKDVTGYNGYRKLRANGYPEGYQTLCCNHNHKKELMRRRK